jgi:hypothetical protein
MTDASAALIVNELKQIATLLHHMLVEIQKIAQKT